MNIPNSNSFKVCLKDIYDSHKIPVIISLNHSPAYQFPNLPEPVAKFKQDNNRDVCFWPQFDWHVMFARAISKADERIGFICIRPDERAEEPVSYRLDKSILMVHFPSTMIKRISGTPVLRGRIA